MNERISELLGDGAADDRLGPTHDDLEARLARSLQANRQPDATAFLRPVSVQFLAQVVGKKPETVRKRLVKCRVAHWENHKGQPSPRYDFLDALSWLIEPRVDLEDWIKSQRVQDMPTHISDQFWKAMRSKQAFERDAGELWHTEDVMGVLGRVFMHFKEATRLWIENLPNKDELSDKQYQALTQNIAALQHDIHQRLIDMPRESRTPSSLETTERDLGEVEGDA